MINRISVERLTEGKYVAFEFKNPETFEVCRIDSVHKALSGWNHGMGLGLEKYKACVLGVNKAMWGVKAYGTKEFFDEDVFVDKETNYENWNLNKKYKSIQEWNLYMWPDNVVFLVDKIREYCKNIRRNPGSDEEYVKRFINEYWDEWKKEETIEAKDEAMIGCEELKSHGMHCMEITKSNYKEFVFLDIVAFSIIRSFSIGRAEILVVDSQERCYHIDYLRGDMTLKNVYEVCPPLEECLFDTKTECEKAPVGWICCKNENGCSIFVKEGLSIEKELIEIMRHLEEGL